MTEQHSVIGVDTANPASASNHMLGERARGSVNSEWVYVDAASSISQYDAVSIDKDYKAKPLTVTAVTNGLLIGFAQASFNSGQKGWVAIRGGKGADLKVNCLKSCNANVELFATSTKGKLDDAGGTATDRIDGVVVVSGSTTASATALGLLATWPHGTNISAGT